MNSSLIVGTVSAQFKRIQDVLRPELKHPFELEEVL